MNEALVVRPEALGLIGSDTLAQMKTQADMFFKSGLCPAKFKNPEQIIITASFGRALGIPFQTALTEIHVIEGVPGLSAKMQLALIRERVKGVKIKIVEQSKTQCIIQYKRPEDDEPTKVVYTWAEVPDTLKNKNNWKNHGVDMLTARCITRMARSGFSDILAGFGYDPQELMDARELNQAPAEVQQVPGAIPKRVSQPIPGTKDSAPAVLTLEENGEVSVDPPEPAVEKEAPLTEDVEAFESVLGKLNDENQVGLAYSRFRESHSEDANTLMAGYSVMQNRLAELKKK